MKLTALKTICLATALLLSPLSNAETVWIDVRSKFEHMLDNIEGDIRIPHGDIVEQVSERYPDRNTEIRLYCRSGGRAGKAMSALLEAGYTDVANVGSIDQARQARAAATPAGQQEP